MRRIWLNVVLVLFTVMLSACGGGGGGGGGGTSAATVSGKALAGAPIVGFVWLKDSAGIIKGPVTIQPDGSFTVDVAGLVAPFYLRAEGRVGPQAYDIYSVATAIGQTNVNPATDMVVAEMQGGAPAAAYAANAVFSQSALNQAIQTVKTILQPLLAAYGASGEFMNVDMSADHTGIDAMFDSTYSVYDPATKTITVYNKTNDAVIVQRNVDTRTTTVNNPDNIPPATLGSDLAAMETRLNAFLAEAKSIYSASISDEATIVARMAPFCASDFGLDDGMTRDQFIMDIFGDGPEWEFVLPSAKLTIIKVSGGVYELGGRIDFADGSYGFWDTGIFMKKENNVWKLVGNGYVYGARINAFGHLYEGGSTQRYESGLSIEIDDEGNNNVQRVRVTGPGLPSAGVELVSAYWDPTDLYLPSQPVVTPISNDRLYVLTDQQINNLPVNLEYTVAMLDANGNVVTANNKLQQRTIKLAKRPPLRSEIPSAVPTFSGYPAGASAAAFTPGMTMSFSYTLPSGTAWADIGVELSGVSTHADTWVNARLDRSQAQLVLPGFTGTPSSAFASIEISDAFGRDFERYRFYDWAY